MPTCHSRVPEFKSHVCLGFQPPHRAQSRWKAYFHPHGAESLTPTWDTCIMFCSQIQPHHILPGHSRDLGRQPMVERSFPSCWSNKQTTRKKKIKLAIWRGIETKPDSIWNISIYLWETLNLKSPESSTSIQCILTGCLSVTRTWWKYESYRHESHSFCSQDVNSRVCKASMHTMCFTDKTAHTVCAS